jgi:hypothetical protein
VLDPSTVIRAAGALPLSDAGWLFPHATATMANPTTPMLRNTTV